MNKKMMVMGVVVVVAVLCENDDEFLLLGVGTEGVMSACVWATVCPYVLSLHWLHN